jgi:hypothetical protein
VRLTVCGMAGTAPPWGAVGDAAWTGVAVGVPFFGPHPTRTAASTKTSIAIKYLEIFIFFSLLVKP